MKTANYSILMILGFLLLLASNLSPCFAETPLETQASILNSTATASGSLDWNIGLQYTRPCSGISLTVPINEDYSLQPIFYIKINDDTISSLNYGLRGIYKLPSQSYLTPYYGIGLGYNEQRHYHAASNTNTKTGGTGYEAFFGFTYNKYLFQPSFELALGGFVEHAGFNQAGLTLNIGLLYSFQP